MKILMVDNDDGRRDTLATATGADVVRVMPRALFAAPELLHDVDALAIVPDSGRDDPWLPRWIVDHLDTLKPACRIAVLGGDYSLALRMNDTLHAMTVPRDHRARMAYHEPTWWRPNCPKTRAGLRKAFGLPVGLEVTP